MTTGISQKPPVTPREALLRADWAHARQIMDLAFTPEERGMGVIKALPYAPEEEAGPLDVQYDWDNVSEIPWDGNGLPDAIARDAGLAGKGIRIIGIGPKLNGPYIDRHLMPHYRQRSRQYAMSLGAYVRHLRNTAFLENELPWLRIPYTTFFDRVEGVARSESVTSARDMRGEEMSLVRMYLEERLKGKSERGDHTLVIRCLGGGSYPVEISRYAMLAHDLLMELGGLDAWRVSIIGHSLEPKDLEEGERGEVPFEKPCDDDFLSRYLTYSRVEEEWPQHHMYRMNPCIRNLISFEWMDFLDTRQLPRLRMPPADVMVMKSSMYIYDHSAWCLDAGVRAALASIIGGIPAGGLFVTDSDVQGAAYYGCHELLQPPHLYFRWPGLRELVHPQRGRVGSRLRKSLINKLGAYEVYRRECKEHDYYAPSGVYLKE